jgi:hypothetical protein
MRCDAGRYCCTAHKRRTWGGEKRAPRCRELHSASLVHTRKDDCSPPLAPQVMCTFARNGANYVQQHWYYCYTCGLVDSRGCCGACVQACHAGHDTVYSACSNFFCDCGSGSAR